MTVEEERRRGEKPGTPLLPAVMYPPHVGYCPFPVVIAGAVVGVLQYPVTSYLVWRGLATMLIPVVWAGVFAWGRWQYLRDPWFVASWKLRMRAGLRGRGAVVSPGFRPVHWAKARERIWS